MDNRQGQLLAHLIEEYVATSEPVGSKLLAEKYHMQVSPATIRNDMAALEDEDYITQPHISAGRVPTEKAYRYWIEHAETVALEKRESALYEREMDNHAFVDSIKSMSKILAEHADNAVVVAFSPYEFYYTGLSSLFAQPEFSDHVYTISLASVIDHLDETLGKLAQKMSGHAVLLGKDNPFDRMCGFVGTSLTFDNQSGCIGILGPMRMHYPMNMVRMQFISELMST